jgi:hypothetical protein
MATKGIDRGHEAGRWLKYPLQPFKQFTLAGFASNPFSGYGPLEPKVQQATVNGRKVVVVSWRNGSKVQVANTGSACPHRADFKGGTPPERCSASTTSRLTSPHHVMPSAPARLASSPGRPCHRCHSSAARPHPGGTQNPCRHHRSPPPQLAEPHAGQNPAARPGHPPPASRSL